MTTKNARYATFSEANFPVMCSTARTLSWSISGRVVRSVPRPDAND